jgi:hypothetical protein
MTLEIIDQPSVEEPEISLVAEKMVFEKHHVTTSEASPVQVWNVIEDAPDPEIPPQQDPASISSYAPLDNKETASLLYWRFKHNIQRDAMDDLLHILTHGEFNCKNLPGCDKSLRSKADLLPLPSIGRSVLCFFS